jgi:protein-S-isoprenylcysteine O-methyltransferase Ste14
VIPRLGSRGEGWVALQMLLLVVTVVVGLQSRGSWPGTARAATVVLGAVLMLAGLVVVVLALTGLGSALTALPAPLEGQTLRTDGPYAVVRHPMYGALILLAGGFALLTSPWALVPTALLAIVLDLKRRVEEELLSTAYADYDSYRRAVPHALLPGIW